MELIWVPVILVRNNALTSDKMILCNSVDKTVHWENCFASSRTKEQHNAEIKVSQIQNFKNNSACATEWTHSDQ